MVLLCWTCIEITFQMSNFLQSYQNILLENESNVNSVGIFPGAFKPPHVGHYSTALAACKNNDVVYIIISKKSRELSTNNTSNQPAVEPTKPTSCDDSNRYKSFFDSDKYTKNIRSVRPAPCARMTSASDLRTALAIKDKASVMSNLPDGSDKELIYDILMKSNDISNPNFGYVTFDQSMQIWSLYKDLLIRESSLGSDQIKLIKSDITPVRDTYEIVDGINNSETAGSTVVNLYVGT